MGVIFPLSMNQRNGGEGTSTKYPAWRAKMPVETSFSCRACRASECETSEKLRKSVLFYLAVSTQLKNMQKSKLDHFPKVRDEHFKKTCELPPPSTVPFLFSPQKIIFPIDDLASIVEKIPLPIHRGGPP